MPSRKKKEIKMYIFLKYCHDNEVHVLYSNVNEMSVADDQYDSFFLMPNIKYVNLCNYKIVNENWQRKFVDYLMVECAGSKNIF